MGSKTNRPSPSELLHQNDEIALQRIAEHNAKSLTEPLGVHHVNTSKPTSKHGWGVSDNVKVSRVRKYKVNTNSRAWKEYLAGKISFSEMIRRTGAMDHGIR